MLRIKGKCTIVITYQGNNGVDINNVTGCKYKRGC